MLPAPTARSGPRSGPQLKLGALRLGSDDLEPKLVERQDRTGKGLAHVVRDQKGQAPLVEIRGLDFSDERHGSQTALQVECRFERWDFMEDQRPAARRWRLSTLRDRKSTRLNSSHVKI